ncbi:Re/Si-specific NAD(P)(+) transhydrogenase subunit alpha [Flavisolibacter ginsenosidimutans]|uniref:NAD(P) transhydrogenase subunit alpha part 1 n=1 Tax=Flavisolibacter ginsenosidimutans TaxID=661481 RepID=A0A5B8UJL5_9BACT|nr:Re/Si-specific NAD(P)(+) transhydrogenase subunit alpha [Flavisolibacter ginsenosidimutans]QEC56195.1 Re/Si-specific NAD(P)(+) transhydrogenase subunit alpha [Flavisolibacter ginsenosidimutans]
MIVGLLKEPPTETRVSLLPEGVSALTKKGIQVIVETGAGLKASATNADYEKAGAKAGSAEDVIAASDVILSIHPPDARLKIPAGKILLGVYQVLYNSDRVQQWTQDGLTVFSLEMLPRTTRAQSMDVLSSQANIAGYKAVLLAANLYPRYFPMFMTAAGSIAPAKVLILGAGVAGLQAIATARRLGAVVEVFDTRPAVKEEVQSLGAKFIEVEGAADASKAGGYAVEQTEEYKQKQQQRIKESIAKADIVITTAQIPGKKAPILITEEMLDGMRNGSIVIDLAAATGGNTPFTKNNESVVRNGVTIVGNSNLQATTPSDASKLYGKNILNFLGLITTKEGSLNLNWDDDLVKGACVAHNGQITNERVQQLTGNLQPTTINNQ